MFRNRSTVKCSVFVILLLSTPYAAAAQSRLRLFSPDTPNAQLIVDGGFEAGAPVNPNWTATSTNFGTPLCTFSVCENANGQAPGRTGNVWAWFGGTKNTENATLSQAVTFPTGGAVSLSYWMRIGSVEAPFTDVFTVRVDGNIVQTFTEPSVPEPAYTLRTVNLSAFADGASHTIQFRYAGMGAAQVPPSAGASSNMVVDDVSLNTATAAGVSVGGRVTSEEGRGVRNALVTISDQSGKTQTAITGPVGAFQFGDVDAGKTYIVSVSSRRYSFEPRLVQIQDNVTDLNFTPSSGSNDPTRVKLNK